ncbi:hypothetical protein F5B18DRAFT_601167 [Nemania serpens]|nr:hypothetical protein F5B18DRAFT_601167 [Nemania serpens]
MQCLKESVVDWDFIFKQARRVLKPGGWIENIEYSSTVFSDNPDFPIQCPAISKLGTRLQAASNASNRSMMAVENGSLRSYLARAGLVNNYERSVKCPLTPSVRSKQVATAFLRTAFATDLQGEPPLYAAPSAISVAPIMHTHIGTCLGLYGLLARERE